MLFIGKKSRIGSIERIHDIYIYIAKFNLDQYIMILSAWKKMYLLVEEILEDNIVLSNTLRSKFCIHGHLNH